ncbi:MAG: CopD family protein [Ilumatobacteraceae bacterium]
MKRGIGTPGRGGLSFVIALVAFGAFFVALADGLGSSSSAHAASTAALVSSQPADGATLDAPPTALTVTFNQAIGSTATANITCNGNPAPTATVALSQDMLSMVVDLSTVVLPRGDCNVRWSVIPLADATALSGNFSFSIAGAAGSTTVVSVAVDPVTGATLATATNNGTATTTDLAGPLGLSRFLSLVFVAILFGAIVLISSAWPEGVEYVLTIRFIRYTWIAAMVFTGAMVACMTAEANGSSFASSLVPTTWTALTDTTPGIAALARIVFVAASGWVALRPDRAIDPASQLPAVVLPGLAVVTMGFSRSGGELAPIGYAAGIFHALAMAVWFGGLVLLARVVLAGPGEDDLVHAVRGFGRLANWAMAITLFTGAVQVWRLDRGHLFDTTHGRLLLFKVVVVMAMVFIGFATRQFVRNRMGRVDAMTTPMAGRLRRAVGFEALLGVAILGITSWMLTTHPGNLVEAGRSSANYAVQLELANAEATLEAKLSLNPARVGRNEMLLEIASPSEGISSIVLTFTPPASSITAHAVQLTITELQSAGSVYIARNVGVPFDAFGQWSAQVDITLANGTVLTQNGLVDVRSDPNATDDAIITTIEEVPVTAAPPSTSSTVSPPG